MLVGMYDEVILLPDLDSELHMGKRNNYIQS